MDVYRLTARNHFNHLIDLIGFFILSIIPFLYFLCIEHSGLAAFYAFGSLFFLQAAFTIVIHINYYHLNKGDELQYDSVNRVFVFKHHGDVLKYSVDNIQKVTMHKSYALHNKRTQFLAWDDYYHSVIEMASGEKIILSSLLLDGNFPLPVDDDKIVVKQSLFRWARGESYQV